MRREINIKVNDGRIKGTIYDPARVNAQILAVIKGEDGEGVGGGMDGNWTAVTFDAENNILPIGAIESDKVKWTISNGLTNNVISFGAGTVGARKSLWVHETSGSFKIFNRELGLDGIFQVLTSQPSIDYSGSTYSDHLFECYCIAANQWIFAEVGLPDTITSLSSAVSDLETEKVDKLEGYSLVSDTEIAKIHTQNTDTYLDQNGANEISAQDISDMVTFVDAINSGAYKIPVVQDILGFKSFKYSADFVFENGTLKVKGAGNTTGKTLSLYNLSNVENVTVMNNGFVGFGATYPEYKLTVSGTGSNDSLAVIRYGSSFGPYNHFKSSRGTEALKGVSNNGDKLGTFIFWGFKDAGVRAAEWVPAASFGAYVENDPLSEHLVKGGLIFSTNIVGDYSVDPTERMRITNYGNVGIGTNSPVMRLDVSHATGDCFRLSYDKSTTYKADFTLDAAGKLTIAAADGVKIQGAGDTTGKALSIFNLAGTENITVLDNGNIGLGVTNPDSAITINLLNTVGYGRGPSISLKNTSTYLPEGDGYNLAGSTYYAGNGIVTAQFMSCYGVGATAPWSFGSGFYITTRTNHPIIFATGVTPIERLRIDHTTGRIGIATTTPAKSLEVSHATGDCFRLSYDKSTTYKADFTLDAAGKLTIAAADGVKIQGAGDTTGKALSIFNLAGTENVTVLDNGKVGIGTTAPTNALTIQSNSYNSYPTLGTAYGQFSITGLNNLYGLYQGVNNSNGNSWMQTMRADTATAYNLLLQPVGGNVGIGTTNPTSILHLQGSTPTLILKDNNATVVNGVYGAIEFKTSDGSMPVGISNKIDSYDDGSGFGDRAAMRFYVNNASALIESMRMTSSGNVGIGTTAPVMRLDISHATGQCFRMRYDGSTTYKADFTLNAAGNLTIAPAGRTNITGDVNLTGVLKIDGVQVVKEQQGAIDSVRVDYDENDTDTPDNIAMSLNFYGYAINSILTSMRNHGLILTA